MHCKSSLIAISVLISSFAHAQSNNATPNTAVMMQQANKIEIQIDSLEAQIQVLLEKAQSSPQATPSPQKAQTTIDPQAANSSLFTPGGQPKPPKDEKAMAGTQSTTANASTSDADNPFKGDGNDSSNDNASLDSSSSSSSSNYGNDNWSNNSNNWGNNNYPYFPPSPSSTSLNANFSAKTYPYNYTLSPRSADPISPLEGISNTQSIGLQFTGNSRTYTEITFCRSNFSNCSDPQKINSNAYTITTANKATINERMGYIPALIGDDEYWVGAIYFMMKSGSTQFKYQFTFPVSGNSNIECTKDGDNKACQIKAGITIPVSQINN